MSHSTITFDLGSLVQPRSNDIVESCHAILHSIILLRCIGNSSPIEATLETVDCKHAFISVSYAKIHNPIIDSIVSDACVQILNVLETSSVPVAYINIAFYKRSNISVVQKPFETESSWTSWLTRSFARHEEKSKKLTTSDNNGTFTVNAPPLERWKLALYVDATISSARQTPTAILQNIVNHANSDSHHLPPLSMSSQNDAVTFPFYINIESSKKNYTTGLASAPSVLVGSRFFTGQNSNAEMMRRSDSDSISIARSKPIDINSGNSSRSLRNNNGSSSPNSPGSSKWHDGINVLKEVIVNVPMSTGSSL